MYRDIIEHLFYEMHFELGVSFDLLLDYVNNYSPFVLAVIGIHLGIKVFKSFLQ